jgi:hypothetical protein
MAGSRREILPREDLIREDVEIQIEAARASMARLHYASAAAELRGALMFLEELCRMAEP